MDETTRALAAATGRHMALIWATLVDAGVIPQERARRALDELQFDETGTAAAKAIENEIIAAVREAFMP